VKNLSVILLILSFVFVAFKINTDAARKQPKTSEELGEMLFFDPILSRDSSISCASCHKPQFAFADNIALSPGVEGRLGNRNTPSAMNMAGRSSFFLDGRAETLEEQALGPIANPVEMDLPIEEAIKRLKRNAFYNKAFNKLYKEGLSPKTLGKAIADFERTLEGTSTPFDQWANGDKNAISESAKRGHKLFIEKAKCFDCHLGPDFTFDDFKNIGLYNQKDLNDAGRFNVTRDSADLGKFKVPGLRNVALTAPYMHNGSFKTLREVIDYYDNPSHFVTGSINTDTLITPLNLSEQEKQDLEAFLHTLTETKSIERFMKK
jgi:cytochrome c peroxidase